MAVLLSDESMGILLLSSFHYSIWKGRTDEDAIQKGEDHWVEKKTRKEKRNKRRAQKKAGATVRIACVLLATTNMSVFVHS